MPNPRCLLVAALAVAACSRAPDGPPSLAKLPDVDEQAALEHIKALSSDEYEGRAPGGKGEELTVKYLSGQFQSIGLEPGNPDGTWVQRVPLVGLTASAMSPLTVKKGDQVLSFAPQTEA